MRKYHVVIASGDLGNAMEATMSVLRAHASLVDDDVTLVTSLAQTALPSFLRRVRYVKQRTPFCLAEAWNDGIAATSPEEDVVLVGSDVRFPQQGALDRLAMMAEIMKGRTILSPALDGYRWYDDLLKPDLAATEGRDVAGRFFGFTCPYLPREVLQTVGAFDEHYRGYGCEDVDYAVRVRRAGYRLTVVPAAVVFHQPGRSEWRDLTGIDRIAQAMNTRYFERRWGTIAQNTDLWQHPEKYPPLVVL